MGERQTNFFKNWLHELQVLDYLSQHPECGVVDYYGFSLRHDEAEAKIVVQICMELMRGGSLRDNLLVLKRKGEKVPLPLAFNIMRQIAQALQGLHAPIHDPIEPVRSSTKQTSTTSSPRRARGRRPSRGVKVSSWGTDSRSRCTISVRMQRSRSV